MRLIRPLGSLALIADISDETGPMSGASHKGRAAMSHGISLKYTRIKHGPLTGIYRQRVGASARAWVGNQVQCQSLVGNLPEYYMMETFRVFGCTPLGVCLRFPAFCARLGENRKTCLALS